MLREALTTRLQKLGEEYGIRLALLFGSAVSGHTHPKSDVDLALLLCEPHLDLKAFCELHHELQSVAAGREIDLSIINHADPLFLRKVTEACDLLYGEPSRLYELKMYAFRRYQDHRHFLEMERRYVREFVEHVNAGR